MSLECRGGDHCFSGPSVSPASAERDGFTEGECYVSRMNPSTTGRLDMAWEGYVWGPEDCFPSFRLCYL